MPVRNYFRTRRVVTAVGNTYDEVKFTPPVPGAIYHIMRFAVEDETTNPGGDLRVGVEGHGYFHQIMGEENPKNGVLYWERWPTFLTMGESLVARFYGAHASDKLVMYLEGWFWMRPVSSESPLRDLSEDND